MSLKIIEARFADSSEVRRRQVRFDEATGLIVDVGDRLAPRADWSFDDDCLAFAGFGDVHIHAREDVSGQHCYKEDFHSASQAALNGGVTHVADMPNNPVPPIDDASYQGKLALAAQAPINFLLYAGIGPGTSALSFAVPYKAYMGPSVGELFFRNDDELDRALARYQGQWVSFHCEDPVELEAHKHEAQHHLRRPVRAELLATATALRLIEKYRLRGKLCHYSAGDGLEAIRQARHRGVDVRIEVTPQHLYFSQEELADHERVRFQMNPPIRGRRDNELLLAALLQGEIDFLATDHAPHTAEEKEKGTSGLTGLDSYGAFVTWLLVEKKVPATLVARVAAENPGAFLNQFLPTLKGLRPEYQRLGLGAGFLRPGFAAQFTVLRLNAPTTLTREMLGTKVGHNPFVGVRFPGKVEKVFLAGKVVR